MEEKREFLKQRIKKLDALIAHFFPYMKEWESVYLVRFPLNMPGTNKNIIDDNFKIIITSVLGTTEMVWNN